MMEREEVEAGEDIRGEGGGAGCVGDGVNTAPTREGGYCGSREGPERWRC